MRFARFDREEVETATFGMADGSVSLLGVLAGLYVAHATAPVVLVTCGGLAIANTVSMGGGQRLAGGSWRMSGVMAVATLAGSLLPAVLPVILGRAGYLLAALAVLALAAGIGELRKGHGRLVSYGESLGIVAAAGLLSVVTALAFGGVAG